MGRRSALIGLVLASVAALALSACGKRDKPAAPETAEQAGAPQEESGAPVLADDYTAIAEAAVADPRRLEADRAEDARRRPAEALAFFQVRPGMRVFEMEAGGGWYTELLSHAVGSNGSVVMQNPESFRAFAGDRIAARLEGGRLPNVRLSYSNFDALDAADASMDLVTWSLGPHELYFTPQGGMSLGDPVKTYAEIFRIVKPGGAFAVIDHTAEPGAPATTGQDLHRLDKAIVLRMAEDAGFALEAESDFLANPEDPLAISVFDPSIRGHTDQFALRFRKPE